MTEPAPLTGGGTGGKILVYLEPSPVPVPDGVARVCDYFRVMTA